MTKVVSLSILFLFSSITVANPQSLLNVETGSWVYPVLDRFVAKGYLFVDTEARPLTRGEIADKVGAVAERSEALSDVDQYLLDRLQWEFREELSKYRSTPLKGYQDQPFLQFREGSAYVALDAGLKEYASLERTKFKDSVCVIDTLLWVSRTTVELESYGQFGEGPAFYQDMTFTRIEGDEEAPGYWDKMEPRGWKSGTAEVERAYLKHALGPVELEVGRDKLWWGPGRWGTLIVSDSARPFDLVGMTARFGGVRARAFTALLSPDGGLYLSAHRVSFELPLSTILGFTETVVYHRSAFPEAQYVNPLVPYYLAEHNLRQDDNTLWNFSLVTCPGWGLRFYGELLIDDVQYARSDSAADKLGGIAGFQIADPMGLPDSDLRCEYTRLNKWVYTHRDTLNKYVQSGKPIGDELGPDSDRLILEVCHRPTAYLEVLLGYRYLRHGEGTLDLSWEEEGGDPRPRFPSGRVEMFNSLFARADLRPTWWLYLDGGVMYTRCRNSSAFGVCPEKAIDRWQFDLALRLDI